MRGGDAPRHHARGTTRIDRPGASSAATVATATAAFIAHGMLLNPILSMRAPEYLEPDDPLSALRTCAFGGALQMLESPA